ncbi:hypothetical protein [Streptomyces sp. NPDC059909]|uniref:hypothetical protein n=1 Tax=Streptomyces sp. NPDC059909 TaxID=3346998 RepID=UPI003652AC3C
MNPKGSCAANPLWNAPVWGVIAATGLLSLLRVSHIWIAGADYGVVDNSVASLKQPAAALQAAAWQFSTLLGLLCAGILVGTGLGQALEGGTWSMLRLHEQRVSMLLFRKIAAALIVQTSGLVLTAGALWAGVITLSRVFPVRARTLPSGAGAVHPVPPDVVTWGDAFAAVASALLVQIFFIAMIACATALLRSVIGSLALGLGPIVVTAPLVLLPVAPLLPHRWIADLLNLPSEAQYQLYFWNQAPPNPSTTVGGLALGATAALLLAAAWSLLRSEHALKPVD